MRKITILLAILMMSSVVMSACDGSGESSGSGVQLESSLSSGSETSSSTPEENGYSVSKYAGINFELNYENYPEILATEYTYTFLSKVPSKIFQYPDDPKVPFDVTKEPVYPKAAKTREELYTALENGSADIALIEMMPDEAKDETKFEYTLIGRVGIAFTTAAKNKVDNITKEDAIKIYRGEITNWSELGGDAGKINVIDFEMPTGEKRAYISERVVLGGDKAGAEILAGSELNEALGMSDYYHFPYEYMEYDKNSEYTIYADDVLYTVTTLSVEAEFETVKALKVDGVLPEGEKIANGEYPFVIECYAVTAKGDIDTTAKNFVQWLSGDTIDGLLKANWGIGNETDALIAMWKDMYFK